MEKMFLQALNQSITAGWLILAVLLLRFVFKKAPKSLRRVLWALVGVRLMFPFSIESIFSLVPSAETIKTDILLSKTPEIDSGFKILNQAVNPVISQSFAPDVYQSVNPMQVVAYIGAILWIGGMALIVLYSAMRYLRLRRCVAQAVLLKAPIWQSDVVTTPFILGLFRPRIYLPFHMDQTSMSCVVAHEQAHIKRGDHWIKFIGFALFTIYWFHPLVWIAYVLLCRDIELACDEHVIANMRAEEKKAYLTALLSLSISKQRLAACPLAFGEVGVKQRIQNVLRYKKPAFWVIAAAMVSCAVLALCFLTNPHKEQASAGQAAQLAQHDIRQNPEAFVLQSCIYITPLSSQYPIPSDGRRYLIGENSFNIEDMQTGKVMVSLAGIQSQWQEMTRAEWESLLRISAFAPDISAVEKRLIRKLSDKYYLFDMDGVYWVGEYRDDQVGMWSIYALAPEGTATDLDASVSAAIKKHYKISAKDSAFESHVTLATLPESRLDAETGETVQTVEVYAMVLFASYYFADGYFTETRGSYIPSVLTFNIDQSGVYHLTDYWEPRDGSYYVPDIRARFAKLSPEQIEDALNAQKYILALTQACYAQAVAYGKIDTSRIIGQLFDEIMSSPAASSAPADYIAEHPIEYRELTYYGDATLRYIFSAFLQGGQTGLKGHLMRVVMEALIGDEALELHADTGQAYFDAWRAAVQRMAAEKGAAYMEQTMPKSWLLLQILNEQDY